MEQRLIDLLSRIADALERLAPPRLRAWTWRGRSLRLAPRRPRLRRCPRSTGSTSTCCKGVDRQKETLLENTLRFARGLPANNACCGARAARARARS